MDFSWRSWRIVRFCYKDRGPSWIYQARITHMSPQDAQDLATPEVDSDTRQRYELILALSRQYMATHINHNVLQKQGYFGHNIEAQAKKVLL